MQLVWLIVITALLVSAKVVNPSEASDRDWLLASLLRGSGLSNRSLFNIAFESKRPAQMERIWIASSDGLHSYDGYNWRRYGKADGLPSDFVRSVLITRSGQLWVGTDRGAGTFDGKSFSTHGSEIGLAGLNVRRIVEDPDAALWFCSDTWPKANGPGGLARLQNGRWHVWHKEDGLPSNYVVNYFRNSEGRQFAVTSGGLAELHGDRWTSPLAAIARPDLNWGSGSIAETPEVGMMVSTGTDVFILKNGAWKAFANTARHEHGITATRDGKIIACGSHGPNQKIFTEWTGRAWKAVSADFPVTHDYIEDLAEAPDGSIYAIGFDSLQRWQRRGSEWRSYAGLPRPLLLDRKGKLWLMDERGFNRYEDGVWQDLGKGYQALLAAPDGSVWAWDRRALRHWSNGEPIGGNTVETGLAVYLSVTLDAQGKLWVFGRTADQRQRLLLFDGGSWTEKSFPDSQWVTGAPDPVAGMWYLSFRADRSGSLVYVNGQSETYPVPVHLISQYRNYLHADRNGNVWLFGDTGLHQWRRDPEPSWRSISHLPASSVIACLEGAGELWFAVDGTLDGKSGLVSLIDGRWRNFETDPILSWSQAEDGKLLFGSKGKFYVVSRAGDSAPIPVLLPEPAQVISVIEDRRNTYWLGTSRDVFLFHPTKTPPRTSLAFFDGEVLQGEAYRARARGYERFQPPDGNFGFWYSWRFDDGAWSPFDPRAERTFATEGMPLGEHRLAVRSRDNDMNIDPAPVLIRFQVHDLPLQERRWFLPAITCIALLLVSLTIATASAHGKLARQARQLEQTVELRTADLRRREEEMRQANRVLQRANEDLRQFAWAASHDLQEPLRMVVAYTQFLAKRYGDQLDETGNQFISFAVTGAQRMQMLLGGLLEYWQVSDERTDGTIAEVDTEVAFKKALDNLELVIAQNEAAVSCSPLPTVPVNEAALTQVFQNLIGNAIKYRKADEAPRIRVAAERLPTAEWQFSVQDNGIGIAREHQNLIFKIFKRLNGNQYSGAGIGLAICVKIVERFGGRLWVESEAGRGSTFYFTIPEKKG